MHRRSQKMLTISMPLLFRIWELLGSSLGPEAEYCEFLYTFPQSLQADVGIVPSNGSRALLFKSFSILYSLIMLPSDAVQSELLTASLNEQYIHTSNQRSRCFKMPN